jgi:putative transposase
VIASLRAEAESYSIVESCQALGVSRSGWYRQWANKGPRKSQDSVIGQRLREHFRQSRGSYGWRRLQQQLSKEGHRCGKRRIRRLMTELGLRALQKGRFRPRTTQSRHGRPVSVNRLRELPKAVEEPQQVWVADITYVPTQKEGWVYLAVEMDLYSRAIVGWQLAPSLATPLVREAFQRAIKAWSAPRIHHSDRGIQYASAEFLRLLQGHGVNSSMSAKANPYDNAVMESFFATLKTECFQHKIPDDSLHAHQMLFDYIESFYNTQRLHSSLGYRSPLEVHRSTTARPLVVIAGEERAHSNPHQRTVTFRRRAQGAQAPNGINGRGPSGSADGRQAVYAGLGLEPFELGAKADVPD